MKKNVLMMVTALGLGMIVSLSSCEEKVCFDTPPPGFSGPTAVDQQTAITQIKEFKKLRDHVLFNPNDKSVDSTLVKVFSTYHTFEINELVYILRQLQKNATDEKIKYVSFAQVMETNQTFDPSKPLNAQTKLLMFGVDSADKLIADSKGILFFNDMKRCPPDECIWMTLPEPIF
jgi:hypothetical protein